MTGPLGPNCSTTGPLGTNCSTTCGLGATLSTTGLEAIVSTTGAL